MPYDPAQKRFLKTNIMVQPFAFQPFEPQNLLAFRLHFFNGRGTFKGLWLVAFIPAHHRIAYMYKIRN